MSPATQTAFTLQRDGRWRSIGPSWQSLAGPNAVPPLGRPFVDAFIADDRTKVSQQLKQLSDAPHWQGMAFEARLSTATGPRRVAIRAAPVPGASAQLFGFIEPLPEPVSEHAVWQDVEHRLRSQLQRNEVILRTTPDAFLVIDDAGLIREANDAFCELMGCTRPEVLSRSVAEFEAAFDALAIREHIRQVRKNGTGRFQSQVRRKDGTLIHVEISVKLTQVNGDRFFFAFSRDISERSHLERELARSAAEWNAVMDAFDDPVCLVDMDDHLIRANAAFYRLLGRVPDGTLGHPLHELLHGGQTLQECAACAARQQHQEVEVTLEAGDPHNPTGHPMEMITRLVRDGQNEVFGMLLMTRDLSADRATAENLRQLSERNRLLLESAGEGIFGINVDGLCSFVNAAAERMLGYPREELLHQPIHQLIHHSQPDGSPYPYQDCPMYQALYGKESRVDNELLWQKDGNSFPADYSAFPIREEGQITGAVVVFRNVAESRAMATKMDYLATHDPLTGLVNRREFESRLQSAIEEARVGGREHLLCYLDLDQFKIINDISGHSAGDELLRQLSTLLRARIRECDTLGRLGGDEFGVLIRHVSLKQAMPIVEKLRQTVQDFRFVWQEKAFRLGVSIGVVSIDRHTPNLAAAFSAADTACYVAKDQGRNRIHVQSPGDFELARRRGEMQWVARVQEALVEDRFVLRRQRIAALHPDNQVGSFFEILLRMVDPDGRIIPPGAFIPSAERFNLMPAVDTWVVRHTLRWLENHPEQLDKLFVCTINLSGNSIGEASFLQFIIAELRATKVAPSKICFEITETAAISNLSRALHFITALKRLGCRFALDDFGSGMSSFGYLKNLPVDYLKIDGNFVREIATDRVDRAMVRAINQVGHVMNIQTIAEHLESLEILEVLQEIGVDYGQGFRIGVPQALNVSEAIG